MDLYTIMLRLIHIFAGIIWVGAGMLIMSVVEPFAKSTGADGERFFGRLMGQSKYGMYMAIAGLLCTLSGLLLFWKWSGGLQPVLFTTAPGVTLTIGSAAGVLAFLVGMTFQGPASTRIAGIAKESAGGVPTPAQMQAIGALQKRIARANVWSAVLFIVSVGGMAVAVLCDL